MRGSFKKKKAKITSIDLKRGRIVLEGVQRVKRDGTKIAVYFNPRVLQIQSIALEDKERLIILSRKKQAHVEPKGEHAHQKEH